MKIELIKVKQDNPIKINQIKTKHSLSSSLFSAYLYVCPPENNKRMRLFL